MSIKIELRNGQLVGVDENGNEVPVEMESLDVGELLGSYPTNVRAFDDSGVVASIEPSESSTPVQDAIDAIGRTNAGAVLLPPAGSHTEAGPIVGGKLKSIVSPGSTTEYIVSITGTGANGIARDVTRDWGRSYLDGWTLAHNDPANSGSAVFFSSTDSAGSNTRGFNIGRMRFANWRDSAKPVIHFDDRHAFEFDWRWVHLSACTGRGFQMNGKGGGPSMTLGTFVYTADGSAAGPRVVDMDGGGHLEIGGLVGLGPSGPLLESQSAGNMVQVRSAHWESSDGTTPQLFELRNQPSMARIEEVQVIDAANGLPDYCYRLGFDNKQCHLARPRGGTAVFTNNVLTIDSTPAAESWYYGPASDITNNAGSSTGLVRSMASAGTGNG